ncbi:MAG: peptidase [bacterium]|nr:peptidase [bacterium]
MPTNSSSATGETPQPGTLGTAWERRTVRTAVFFAISAGLAAGALAWLLQGSGLPLWMGLVGAAVVGWAIYAGMTRKIRRRRRILAQPFPAEWEAALQGDVVFFRALAPEEQVRFRREVQIFIGEKHITGIKTEVDTRTLVLAAASAVIPIFGFPDWEWDQISEVLIYPGRFDQNFDVEGGQSTLGMVGTGFMNRMMVLSKPDLLQGFRNAEDKRNVGLHEFAHLVDKADGSVDGVPAVGLDRQAIGPWVELVRRKMQEIEDGDSDLNRYALTNEAEFFAVATEYLFERPGLMRRKHPELFAMMQKIFAQDLGGRVAALRQEFKRGPVSFGRNSPCPCGSGLKYKKCCLRKM